MDLGDLALRPLAESDLDQLHLLAAPETAGFNWSGYRSEAALRKRFAEDGYLGAEDGWLIAGTSDGLLPASVARLPSTRRTSTRPSTRVSPRRTRWSTRRGRARRSSR